MSPDPNTPKKLDLVHAVRDPDDRIAFSAINELVLETRLKWGVPALVIGYGVGIAVGGWLW